MNPITVRIAAWFAAGLGKALLIGFAIFGVIALPCVIVQTVEIYGFDIGPFPFIGRITIFEGYQHMVATAQGKIDAANNRYTTLSAEYSKRTMQMQADGNKAVADQKAKTDVAEAKLAQRIADEQKTHNQLERILSNAKPGDERALGPVVLQYLNSLRN